MLLKTRRHFVLELGHNSRKHVLRHQIIRVGALEVLDVPILEMPDARGDFVDHVVVVRHQQHRAGYFCSAMFSALIDSRSRWLVGSSSTRTFGFCSISLQKISRADSPPESARVGFRRPRR
jgi:hypothetical protein